MKVTIDGRLAIVDRVLTINTVRSRKSVALFIPLERRMELLNAAAGGSRQSDRDRRSEVALKARFKTPSVISLEQREGTSRWRIMAQKQPHSKF